MTSVRRREDSAARRARAVFLGFPLHAPGRPGLGRASISTDRNPMLFLQGTRDALGRLELMHTVCERLGDRATLHVVDGGDHSFAGAEAIGRSEAEVLAELAATIARGRPRRASDDH